MRFLRFMQEGIPGLAVLAHGQWHGLLVTDEANPGDLDDLIARGANLSELGATLADGAVIDPDAVEFLPPLQRSRKIICVGLNYRDHSAESGFKQPEYPTLFFRVGTSLCAHRRAIERPDLSDTLDFEGELAAIIGVGGKHIALGNALAHVAGYSIFNDVSVREYQFKAPQWTVGKNFDGTGAFGPWFVTADEFPDGGRGCKLQTRLNGEVVQSAMIDDMVFDLPNLIQIISEAITLEAGDVIVTGTPAGVGHGREPKLYMRPGDVCEVEIDGLGVLTNPIVSAPSATSGL